MSHNLALGYLASYLLKEGHHVNIIDALAEGKNQITTVHTRWGQFIRAGLAYEEILARIPKETDIIGITAPFTHHAAIVRELSSLLKDSLPGAKIIIGGVYPSTLPEKALSQGVDYIIKGEGEIPLARIAKGDPPSQIEGVWFRDKTGHFVDNGVAEMVKNLDEIPFPARHLLPMEKYHHMSSRGRVGEKSATVITSRGCPFNCTFCSVHAVYGWKWRARSPQNIIDELKWLKEKFGVQHIEFEDDNLSLDTSRAEKIFDGMIGLGLTWSCSNGIRIDRLNRSLLTKMKASGCRVLNLGIEHGDPEMLRIMNKMLDLKKVEEVMSICLELAIPTVGFWVICHPGETRERFERGLEFFKKLKDLGMYGFGVHLAWPMPGTELFRMCEENGWLADSDIEECLIFPGPFYIECPDFDAAEASNRLKKAKAVLDVDTYPYETNSKTAAFRASIAGIILNWRLGRVNPVYLDRNRTDGFYPTETTPQGTKFQWSKPRSSIRIKPVSNKAKKLIVNLDSIADKPMTIAANGSVILDAMIQNGNNELTLELSRIRSLNGELKLEFVTQPTIPSEIDASSKDLRELGVSIRWLKLI